MVVFDKQLYTLLHYFYCSNTKIITKYNFFSFFNTFFLKKFLYRLFIL
jgi:hypothetical protein